MNYNGLLGVISSLWRYPSMLWTLTCCGNDAEDSVVRREVCWETRTFRSARLTFPPLLIEKEMSARALGPPTTLWEEYIPIWLDKSQHLLVSHFNRGCYCILRRNGHVLLPSFFHFLYLLKAILSYLLFTFLLHILDLQGLAPLPLLTQKDIRLSSGVSSLGQLETCYQWRAASPCCLSPFPLTQIGTADWPLSHCRNKMLRVWDFLKKKIEDASRLPELNCILKSNKAQQCVSVCPSINQVASSFPTQLLFLYVQSTSKTITQPNRGTVVYLCRVVWSEYGFFRNHYENISKIL